MHGRCRFCQGADLKLFFAARLFLFFPATPNSLHLLFVSSRRMMGRWPALSRVCQGEKSHGSSTSFNTSEFRGACSMFPVRAGSRSVGSHRGQKLLPELSRGPGIGRSSADHRASGEEPLRHLLQTGNDSIPDLSPSRQLAGRDGLVRRASSKFGGALPAALGFSAVISPTGPLGPRERGSLPPP
jgi:hypothetical protein